MLNPQAILKYKVLPVVAEKKLDQKATRDLMLKAWVDEYVPLKLFAPMEESEAPAPKVVKKAVKKQAPVIDDLWGDDLSEDWMNSYVEQEEEVEETAPSEEPRELEPPVVFNPHVAIQVTNAQLKRMKFTGGGIVITALNYQLDAVDRDLEIGSEIMYGGRKVKVVQKQEIVYWKFLDQNLYTVVNCEE